jgi:hypothetical protein
MPSSTKTAGAAAAEPDIRTYTVSLAPGDIKVMHLAGNFVYIAEADGLLDIAISPEAYLPRRSEGFRIGTPVDYRTVQIRNTGALTVTALIVLGHGTVEDYSEPKSILQVNDGIAGVTGALDSVNAALQTLNAAAAAILARLNATHGTAPAFASAEELAALPTAALETGRTATLVPAATGLAETWQLRADATDPATDAANGLIRPDDYNAAANPRAWYRA